MTMRKFLASIDHYRSYVDSEGYRHQRELSTVELIFPSRNLSTAAIKALEMYAGWCDENNEPKEGVDGPNLRVATYRKIGVGRAKVGKPRWIIREA